jgi:succinate dehydrogenase / fumarate reductase cytochrome b subunit
MWHVLQMHNLGSPLKSVSPDLFAAFDPHDASATASRAIQVGVWVQILYAIGILACVYHLANGLWTMGITWGVWTSPAAMRRADYVCSTFGVLLAIVGLGALVGFARHPVPSASSNVTGSSRSPSAILDPAGNTDSAADAAPDKPPAGEESSAPKSETDVETSSTGATETDLSGLDRVDAENAAAARRSESGRAGAKNE